MRTPLNMLATRGQALWRRFGRQDGPAADHQLAALLTSWQSAPRAYHTLSHLQDCLWQVDLHAAQLQQPDAVALALFYHDAVYDPQRQDNEPQSAQWLWRDWQDHLPTDTLQRLQGWILATATHDPAALDDDGLRLLDIDLSILARDPDTYAHYARQIRQEYAFVPEPDYRRGRAQVLQRFLQRERLYHSDLASPHWEGQARQNLQQELRGLLD